MILNKDNTASFQLGLVTNLSIEVETGLPIAYQKYIEDYLFYRTKYKNPQISFNSTVVEHNKIETLNRKDMKYDLIIYEMLFENEAPFIFEEHRKQECYSNIEKILIANRKSKVIIIESDQRHIRTTKLKFPIPIIVKYCRDYDFSAVFGGTVDDIVNS